MGWTKVEEVGVEDMIVFLAGRSQAHVSQGFFSFFFFMPCPPHLGMPRDGKILSCIWMLVKRKEYKKKEWKWKLEKTIGWNCGSIRDI